MIKEGFIWLLCTAGLLLNRRKRDEKIWCEDRRKMGIRTAQKKVSESIDRLNDVIDRSIGGKP